MINTDKVLREPFDIEVHKKTFINYLEIIILEDGTPVYATPSHQEKLIAISCAKLGITRDELNDLCPLEFYFDFMNRLCQMSNCIVVWNEHSLGIANDKQKETLLLLQKHKLYNGIIR